MKQIKFTEKERARMIEELDAECSIKINHRIIDEFIGLGTLYRLPRGKNFVTAGEINDNIYIMVDGVMRSWYLDGENEITEAFGLSPSVLLSYHSYCMGLPALCNFEACTSAKVLEINLSDYDALIRHSPQFSQWCLRVAQTQLYHHELRRRTFTGSARERYIAFMQNRPQVMRHVPLRMIASYLGITPQYLYKLRGEIR